MIAKHRRIATQDFLLVAVATTVIVLSTDAVKPDRQVIEVRQSDGQIQQFSLACDDPRLMRIRRRIADRRRIRPTPQRALKKWQLQLASHYVADESANAVAQSGGYWGVVRDRTEASISDEEDRFSKQRDSAGPPPLALGTVIHSVPSRQVLARAIICGCAVAMLFSLWAAISPQLLLDVESAATDESPPSDAATIANQFHDAAQCNDDAFGTSDRLRMELPAEWLRVEQLIGFHARRACMAALTLTAFVCLAL